LGTCARNCSRASRPPAEAPIPTIGKCAETLLGALADASAGAGCFFLVAPRSAERAVVSVVVSRARLEGRPVDFPLFFMAELR
jgi:hypothetical protein